MKQLAPTTTNSIVHFAKVNHLFYCLLAHEKRDIKNFCRNFFFYVMDRKGRVRFDQPIVCVIHGLTGWQKGSIRKAIAFLAKAGEIMRVVDDDNAVIVNDMVANKQGLLVPYRMPYNGKNPDYDRRRLDLAEAIQKLSKHTEEKLMYVAQELKTLRQENAALKEQLAELKGELRGYDRGIERGYRLRDFKPVEQEVTPTTPAPIISLVRNEGSSFCHRH